MDFLKSKMVRFCIAEVILAIIIVMIYFYYKDYQKDQVHFQPLAITANGLTLNSIPSSKVMEGTAEGDLMIATPEGSKIFAKGGLNYVISNTGPDEFYYSLCSTKIIDNKVNVIENFNSKKDKLKIFCAHHPIKLEDLNIIHSRFKKMDVTYITIKGEHVDTAIVLLGNIDIKTTDIILNERWNASKY